MTESRKQGVRTPSFVAKTMVHLKGFRGDMPVTVLVSTEKETKEIEEELWDTLHLVAKEVSVDTCNRAADTVGDITTSDQTHTGLRHS